MALPNVISTEDKFNVALQCALNHFSEILDNIEQARGITSRQHAVDGIIKKVLDYKITYTHTNTLYDNIFLSIVAICAIKERFTFKELNELYELEKPSLNTKSHDVMVKGAMLMDGLFPSHPEDVSDRIAKMTNDELLELTVFCTTMAAFNMAETEDEQVYAANQQLALKLLENPGLITDEDDFHKAFFGFWAICQTVCGGLAIMDSEERGIYLSRFFGAQDHQIMEAVATVNRMALHKARFNPDEMSMRVADYENEHPRDDS